MTADSNKFFSRRFRILAGFCLINFCTGGLYVWSIFSPALANKLSMLTSAAILPTDLGPIFGTASGITPFMMLAGGIINDRFGPKWMIGFGGVALTAGYCFASNAESIAGLYATYGILVGVGTGLINGCTINTAVKLFPDHRGFAGGLVTASLGIGAAALPFVARTLIDAFGIDAALLTFAAFSAAVILPLTMSMKTTHALSLGPIANQTKNESAPKVLSLNWYGMLRTWTFWPLALLFMTSATIGLMILSSASSMASLQAGLSAGSAAAAVSLISIANTCGRFVSGTASDTIGRVPALCVALAMALGGLWLLKTSSPTSPELFFVGLIGIGLCFGAFIGIYPSLVADEYGPEHNSVNFSILMLGYSVGGIVGPLLMKTAGTSGSFDRLYGISAGMCLFGLICALAYSLAKKHIKPTVTVSA